MSDMEDSNDSRTASIGRKRARETEQPLALDYSPEEQTTPSKRPRLAASALDSHPEPALKSRASRPGRSPSMSDADSEDEGGVEVSENTTSGNMQSDSTQAPARPSTLVTAGEDRSDDSLLSEVVATEQARKRGRKKKAAPSKEVFKLTKPQKELVRKFENERAEGIFLDQPKSPDINTDTKRQRCLILEVTAPTQVENVDKTRQKQSMQVHLLHYLARNISEGLTAVYYSWSNTASKVIFRILLVYSNPEQANFAAAVVPAAEIKVFGAETAPPKALPVSSSDSNGWSRFEKGLWKPYADEHNRIVCRKLREGVLDPKDYEGFSQQRQSTATTKADRLAQVTQGGSVGAQDLPIGNDQNGQQPTMSSTAPESHPPTSRQLQHGQLTTNGEVEVVDARGSAFTPIDGSNEPADTATAADTVMDEAAVDGEQLWFADTKPSAVPRDASPPLIAEMPVKLFQVSAVERELQGRYWKIFNDHDTVRCLTCAAVGHISDVCPSRTCKHCLAVDDHFSSACPSVRKCLKCRERGHSEADCPSKLRCISPGGLVCDLCHETGHFEENCCWLWRTFNINAVPYSKKVGRLLVGCYNCGSDLHWGNDCPLHGKKKRFDVTTFSANEANKFILPVAQHAANVKAKRNMGISIKGRAEKDAITISDDDEPSVFLGKRVQPPPPRGKIRVNAPAPKGARKADRYQITPNDYDRRPVYDHPPPNSYSTRPRSRSPPRQRYDDYQNGYDSYQGRYEDHQGGGYRARSPLASSYGRGQSYQPPLPNEPVPPPRRDRYGSYDRGYQPPPPPEPVPAPRKALGSGGRGRGRGRGRR
ncbi:hypothetical protein H2201_008004 [Coniosporium apollinis]|uniref:CCHC-type domain-containing protein n=1 Tax=Coniosporium apollinis TaxID=61459 RepID=A0ABQ9NI35_9PEZI|nr:hypothetical protein H2201_008004 [Coniosporium apollinis]